MRFVWAGCLAFSTLLAAGTPEGDANVNCRYKVETVIVSGKGWSTDFASPQGSRISAGLGKRISALIGNQLNPSALDDVASRLRKELQASVTRKVERGANPEYVKVVYQVGPRNSNGDVSVTKFSYNSHEGWNGAVQSDFDSHQNRFTLGLVSDGDDLAERYAGLMARYENMRLGSDRLRLRFEFDGYHDQWNSATLSALPPYASSAPAIELTSAPYRTRQDFSPAISYDLTDSVTVTAGVSFERFQNAFPAAHTEAANTVVADVRYDRSLEGSGAEQNLDAGYSLRAATRVLDSDYVYARQLWTFRYTLTHGRHVLRDNVSGGTIAGRAPLYDRFFLGNSRTLRGWDKFEIDPLGGNRMVHNSVEYRYGVLEVFYDAGAIWDQGQPVVTPRNGIGVGLRHGDFEMAVAFPIRNGRADPAFIIGMNY